MAVEVEFAAWQESTGFFFALVVLSLMILFVIFIMIFVMVFVMLFSRAQALGFCEARNFIVVAVAPGAVNVPGEIAESAVKLHGG